MDTIDAILTRRSIRKYEKKTITKKQIHMLLETAMSAPSAGNEQPWHFIIIDDEKILSEIPAFHNHATMLKDASLGILICGDLNLGKHKDMWIQDCSAATQNMLLAAHASGLGAVWLGVYPREERMQGLTKLLEIPKHVIPFSLISIGYPLETKERTYRFKESRLHYNKW